MLFVYADEAGVTAPARSRGLTMSAAGAKYGIAVAIAAAYAAIKLYLGYRWWAEGFALWAEAFAPLPSADYGHLLGAKWIGTRNLMLGAALAATIALRRPAMVAAFLLMGAGVEFFDGVFLAYGKFVTGFSGPRTDFYMAGAFGLVAALLAGTFLGLLAQPGASGSSR